MAHTSRLTAPSKRLSTVKLDIEYVDPSALVRVSRHDTGEPYFGRSGGCRFDDPLKSFGTCYLGFNLTVAFAESVLHDLSPVRGRFSVPVTEVSGRFALAFQGPKLKLAKLYGTSLLRLGGNGELSGTARYRLPQAWSVAIEAHPDAVDGFLYMSRRVNNELAVVLFHRPGSAPSPMTMHHAVQLHHHTNFVDVINDLGITLT